MFLLNIIRCLFNSLTSQFWPPVPVPQSYTLFLPFKLICEFGMLTKKEKEGEMEFLGLPNNNQPDIFQLL